MIKVIIESPYDGEVSRNRAYLQRCIADSLRRGEAPFASHLLYTEALNDDDPRERIQGIRAGFAWGVVADLRAIYVDYGISDGMQQGIDQAGHLNQMVEHRRIGQNDE